MGTVVVPPYVGGPLRLEPFTGLMLHPRRVSDPASARLYSRPHRAVAARINQWRERGMLSRDSGPAIYLHEYTSDGITVRGLVGALDVSVRATKPEERVVLPHEGIHPTQADELADRMVQMQLNPGPILLVHHAPDAVRAIVADTASSTPNWEFDDRANRHHRLWAIRRIDVIARLQDAWATSRVLIADGHHRYAAYLRMQAREPGAAYDHGLAMIVDQTDTPLHLGAIHRVLEAVKLDDIRVAAATIGLVVESLPRQAALDALRSDVVAATDGRDWITVALPVTPTHPAVELVHRDLIPALPHGPRTVSYHHNVQHTLTRLRKHRGVALILPAATVDDVLEIAADDRLLPEKATSFQPKPPTGVLLRTLGSEIAETGGSK
jgi:uncharacterized protein (DUF1015 family)